ncbi:MAG: hypothetical protein CSA54_04495 [Gammaproteobacteria bacterium]|nr:MAG: hypothetical protein CSA54_04495 [Gammaproteobacteria bacterium]
MNAINTLPALAAVLLSACSLYQPAPAAPQGVYINPHSATPPSCQQLQQQIDTLEQAPRTDVYNPGLSNAGTPFAFKNANTDSLKQLKRRAARQGCYDRPAHSAPSTPVGKATRLSFEQCFQQCQRLTKRSAEQCFDSCK